MRFASKPGDSASGACPIRNTPTGVNDFLQRDPAQVHRLVGFLTSSFHNSTIHAVTRPGHELPRRHSSCLHSGSSPLAGGSRRQQLERPQRRRVAAQPGLFLRVILVR